MTTTEARLEDQKSNSLTTTIKAVFITTVTSISSRDFGAVHGSSRCYYRAGCIAINWKRIRYICRWIAMDSYCLWLDFGRLSDA